MLIPLKYFTTTCSSNLSAGSFPQRKEGGTGIGLLRGAVTVQVPGRPLCVCLTGRFSLLPLAAAPTLHILPPSVLRVTGLPSSLSLPHIFFETFVRHWSTFCALCCYKFIPLLGVLGRLNFIFEKSKRIEMEKKKKSFLPHSYWHTLK